MSRNGLCGIDANTVADRGNVERVATKGAFEELGNCKVCIIPEVTLVLGVAMLQGDL